jgi:glycosyltransferase involved in cell wall biosynthesis
VTPTFHLLTGEYPPRLGGVGDYTARIASALARRGAAVHVWSPAAADGTDADGVVRHSLPDAFGRQSRRVLERGFAASPGRIILQYVPNALGRRGANLRFCVWLARMRRRGADIRVMFHEPYFYFTLARPLTNLLALAQRAMAAVLLHGSRVVYLSTETWIEYLRPYAPAGTSWVALAIPSTIGSHASADAIARWRTAHDGSGPLAGHFGTYGVHVATELQPAIIALLEADPAVRVLLIGRRSDLFADAFGRQHPGLAGRIHAAGALAESEVAAALKACDVLIQPYPDGVTTRRTSVMAGLAAGVATVTTAGRLTERVWHETQAAVLVPASDAASMCRAALALLRDAESRRAQGVKGQDVYDRRFGIDHSADVLLST